MTVLAAPQRTGSEPLRVLRREITSETRLAVERGLAYLIENRGPTGNFGPEYPVACNALAGLALLSGGHTPRDGPYADILQETVDALLPYQRDNGYFDDRNRGSRMYGHGFATLFLAQVYGLAGEQDEQVGVALKRAVRLIEGSQCRDGGWDYWPGRQFATDKFLGISLYTGTGDTSITVCQTMALRAARNLGISVDSDVIARAKGFIERSQNRNGGFAYRRNMVFGSHLANSDFPRSAAGVCVLLSLGEYNTSKIERGFDYLMRTYKTRNDFPFYAHYYCTQAMFQTGGRRWREYYPWVRRKLLDRQQRDGSWKATSYGCPAHATAMAIIVLQTPYRFLPIHER